MSIDQLKANEAIDLLQVRGGSGRARENQRERQARVLLAQQDAEQIEDFLRSADAPVTR
jgi:hypothetical protein